MLLNPLPNEVFIHEIVSRLPYLLRMRAMLVSRSWYSSISSAEKGDALYTPMREYCYLRFCHLQYLTLSKEVLTLHSIQRSATDIPDEVSLKSLRFLRHLAIKGDILVTDLSTLENLEHLDISEQVSYQPLTGLKSIRSLYASEWSCEKEIGKLSGLTLLSSMELSTIRTETLTSLPNLVTLYLAENCNVDLSYLTKLQQLVIPSSSTVARGLSCLTKLTCLRDYSGHMNTNFSSELTSLLHVDPLPRSMTPTSLSQLRSTSLSGEQANQVLPHMQEMTSLTIRAVRQPITVSMSHLHKLRTLILQTDKMPVHSIFSLTQLRRLDLSAQQEEDPLTCTYKDLARLTNLQWLSLTYIHLDGSYTLFCSSLETLYLSSVTGISSGDLDHLQELYILSLHKTNVPVAQFRSLRELSVYKCDHLGDQDIESLHQLTSLFNYGDCKGISDEMALIVRRRAHFQCSEM